MKELRAHLHLHPFDILAQGLLGDIQLPCGGVDGAHFAHSQKISAAPEIHAATPLLPRYTGFSADMSFLVLVLWCLCCYALYKMWKKPLFCFLTQFTQEGRTIMASKELQTRRGSGWERTAFEGKPLAKLRSEMGRTVLSELKAYDEASWEEGAVGPVSGKWIYPEKPSGGLLYYIHGGGFTLGSSGIPMPFLLELSHWLGLACFSADNRLTPEHVFSAAPEDAFAGCKALLDLGYDPARVVVCGESAGATLSLAVTHMAKATGLPLPRAVVALSPVTDAMPELDRGSKVEVRSMRQLWDCFVLLLVG